MSKVKLSVKNLTKSFSGTDRNLEVLKSLNMHVNNGEFVSVVGPSGCGKSTLFNIIAGITEQTAGTVAIDGKTKAERLGKSGYMPQSPLLLPWKTVRGNVMLGLLLRNKSVQNAKKQADILLEKFGLLYFADQYPDVLSGGMAQKVALLRTILFNKDFLLMDEPFGALDAITRLTMQMWLLDVWNEVRSTVLFITHDIREAILLSDRIYVLGSRPAAVIKEVAVNLPRPRRREFMSKRDSVLLEAELENMLLQL